MRDLLKFGYKAKKRPSGHDISKKFSTDNGAAIPPNIIAVANTESNSHYLRYCREKKLPPHPARYPQEVPEFFVRMLTDRDDLIVDPFAGSCVTGEVCERLGREWVCIDLVEEYLRGGVARFEAADGRKPRSNDINDGSNFYKLARTGLLWNGPPKDRLRKDGGLKRPPTQPTHHGK
jgi:site-specific DNA-methyltransferase (cytosine-N4-specific)